MRILLERNDVNPSIPDEDSQTPLWFAVENGHVGIVRMLLERNEINPDTPDKYDQTPLSRAVRNGDERMVELLRDRAGFIPRYAASPQPTDLLPEPVKLSEPPRKRTRKV